MEPDRQRDDEPASPIARLREEQLLGERMALLEQAPLFAVLVPADLRVLASKFHAVRYRRGEVIFREGETPERIFLIGEGRVKLTTASFG